MTTLAEMVSIYEHLIDSLLEDQVRPAFEKAGYIYSNTRKQLENGIWEMTFIGEFKLNFAIFPEKDNENSDKFQFYISTEFPKSVDTMNESVYYSSNWFSIFYYEFNKIRNIDWDDFLSFFRKNLNLRYIYSSKKEIFPVFNHHVEFVYWDGEKLSNTPHWIKSKMLNGQLESLLKCFIINNNNKTKIRCNKEKPCYLVYNPKNKSIQQMSVDLFQHLFFQ